MRDIILRKKTTKKLFIISNIKLLGGVAAKFGKFAGVGIAILTLVFSSSYFNFSPLPAIAGTTVFTETFSTTTYKGYADASGYPIWNTTSGTLRERADFWTGISGGNGAWAVDSGISSDFEFVLDSNNKPFVARVISNDIYFTRWNNSGWRYANGTTIGSERIALTAGNSYTPFILLDSSGRPNIIWVDEADGDSDIYFTKWNGSAWVKADGTTAGYDNVSNNTTGSINPRFALDSSDRPLIVWEDGTIGINSDIYFTKWSGTAWVKANGTAGYDNVSNNPTDVSLAPLIKLDASNNPFIVWDDFATGNSDVYFTKWSGSAWVKADGVTSGKDIITNGIPAASATNQSLLLNPSGRPYILWVEDDGLGLGNSDIYFTKWNGTAWVKANGTAGYDNVSNNTGMSQNAQLKLDGADIPFILWEDGTTGSGDIYFTKWNGANWTRANSTTLGYENLSGTTATSQTPQLQLDSVGAPHVVWIEFVTGYSNEIYFTKWSGAAWVKADGTAGYDNLAQNAASVYSPQFELNSFGNPIAFWVDERVGALNPQIYYSQFSFPLTYSETASSLKINGSITSIIKATLTATQTLNGQTVSYEMTNDGGTTWNSVTSGVEYTFSSTGNDLRWRANLFTSDTTKTPVIDTVSISYIDNNPPVAPSLNSPVNGAADTSLTPSLSTTATDSDSDDIQYKIDLTTSAAFPSWVKADGATSGYDNVSNNSGSSGYAKFQLDSSGKPNVVWWDGMTGSGDIYFSKWNGSAWTRADGTTAGYDNVSNTSGSSYYPSFQIDSTDKPNIVWCDNTSGNYEIYFSKWNGSGWVKANGTAGYDNVSNTSNISCWQEFPRLKIDSTDKPYIAWRDEETGLGDVYFSKWNGSAWTRADGTTAGYDNVSAGTSNVSYQIRLELNSSNAPYILWSDLTTSSGQIYFSKFNGSAWTRADGTTAGYDNVSSVVGSGGGEGFPVLKINSLNQPNIVWTNNIEIRFSKFNGSAWTRADGTTAGYDNVSNTTGGSYRPDFQLNIAGNPNVVWQDITDGDHDIYFSKWSGTAWVKANGTAVGYDNISNNSGNSSIEITEVLPSVIKLDSTEKPNIVWYDNTPGNYEIYFSKWNGLNWEENKNISNNSGNSYEPYIQLNSSGMPFVVWFDNTPGNYDVFFSKRSSSADIITYDQSISQTGWSGQNSGGGTRYTSGTMGTYAISSALSSCVTYYWRSFAKDPLGLNSWSSASSTRSFTTTGCNAAPSATAPNTISQSTDGLGRMTFQTAISDADSNDTKLKVEYSEDNGTTWYKAQLASVSPSSGSVDLANANAYQIGTANAIDTSTGTITLTIVWDTKSSSNGNGALTGDQADIKVRVTPNDSTVDGTAQASSAFEVDNLNPSGLGSLSFSNISETQIQANWSQATETNFQRYRLYYGTNSSSVENKTSSYEQMTSISTTSRLLTGLTSSTTYYFKLFATDLYGNELSTATANQATLTPSVVIPPPAPPAPPAETPPTPEVPPETPPEELPEPEKKPEEKPKPGAPFVISINESETLTQNTFTLQGVAPADSVVIMLLDNSAISQTQTNSSGTFSFFFFNLSNGSHTLRLQTRDAEGNVSDPIYFSFSVNVPEELILEEETQKIYPEAAPEEIPAAPEAGEGEAAPPAAGEGAAPIIPPAAGPSEAPAVISTLELLPEVVQIVAKTVSEAPRAAAKAAARIQEVVPKPHQKWEEQTPIEKTVNVTAQAVVTAGAATGVALSTGIVTLNVGRLAVSFSDINLLLIRTFSVLLSAAGVRRKKPKPWGTVYDSQTKQPLDPAYVQLLDEKGNELETQITDLEGRFGFFIKQSGVYSIIANKTNYKFPSERLQSRTSDELYDNLYFGIPLSLQEGQLLGINIPMDAEKFDWNEFAKKEQGYVKINPKIEAAKKKFAKYAFYSGFIFTPVSYLFSPSKLNLFLFGLYAAVLLLRFFNIKEKQYGMVYNKQTNQPLSFAVVRAFYPQIDRPVKTVIADKYGRYYLIVPNGKYYLKVEQKNPDGTYSLIFQTEPFDVKKGIVTEEVVLG